MQQPLPVLPPLRPSSRASTVHSEPCVVAAGALEALLSRRTYSACEPARTILKVPSQQSRYRASRTVSFSDPIEIDAFGQPVPSFANSTAQEPSSAAPAPGIMAPSFSDMSVRSTPQGSYDGITLTLPQHEVDEANNYYPRWQLRQGSTASTTSNTSHPSAGLLGQPTTTLPPRTSLTPSSVAANPTRYSSSASTSPDQEYYSAGSRPTPSPSSESSYSQPPSASGNRRTTTLSSNLGSTYAAPADPRMSHLVHPLPAMQSPAATVMSAGDVQESGPSFAGWPVAAEASHKSHPGGSDATFYQSTLSHASHASHASHTSQVDASRSSHVSHVGGGGSPARSSPSASLATPRQSSGGPTAHTHTSQGGASQQYSASAHTSQGGTMQQYAASTHTSQGGTSQQYATAGGTDMYYALDSGLTGLGHAQDETHVMPSARQESLHSGHTASSHGHTSYTPTHMEGVAPEASWHSEAGQFSTHGSGGGASEGGHYSAHHSMHHSPHTSEGGHHSTHHSVHGSGGGASEGGYRTESAHSVGADPTGYASAHRLRRQTPAPASMARGPRATAPDPDLTPRYGEPELATRLEAVMSAPARLRSRSTAPAAALTNLLGRFTKASEDDLGASGGSDLGHLGPLIRQTVSGSTTNPSSVRGHTRTHTVGSADYLSSGATSARGTGEYALGPGSARAHTGGSAEYLVGPDADRSHTGGLGDRYSTASGVGSVRSHTGGSSEYAATGDYSAAVAAAAAAGGAGGDGSVDYPWGRPTATSAAGSGISLGGGGSVAYSHHQSAAYASIDGSAGMSARPTAPSGASGPADNFPWGRPTAPSATGSVASSHPGTGAGYADVAVGYSPRTTAPSMASSHHTAAGAGAGAVSGAASPRLTVGSVGSGSTPVLPLSLVFSPRPTDESIASQRHSVMGDPADYPWGRPTATRTASVGSVGSASHRSLASIHSAVGSPDVDLSGGRPTVLSSGSVAASLHSVAGPVDFSAGASARPTANSAGSNAAGGGGGSTVDYPWGRPTDVSGGRPTAPSAGSMASSHHSAASHHSVASHHSAASHHSSAASSHHSAVSGGAADFVGGGFSPRPTAPSGGSAASRDGVDGAAAFPAFSTRHTETSGSAGGAVHDPLMSDAAALEEDLAAVMKRLPASLRYGARDAGADIVSTGLLQQLYARLAKLQAVLKQRESDAQKTARLVADLKARLADSEAHETDLENNLMMATRQLASRDQHVLDVEQRLRDAERRVIEATAASVTGNGFNTRSEGGAAASATELNALRSALDGARSSLAERDAQLSDASSRLAERDRELREAERVLRASEREMASQLQTAAGRLLPLAEATGSANNRHMDDTARRPAWSEASSAVQEGAWHQERISDLEQQVKELQAAYTSVTSHSSSHTSSHSASHLSHATHMTHVTNNHTTHESEQGPPLNVSLNPGSVTAALEQELEALTSELQQHQATMDAMRVEADHAKHVAESEKASREALQTLADRLRADMARAQDEAGRLASALDEARNTQTHAMMDSHMSHMSAYVNEKTVTKSEKTTKDWSEGVLGVESHALKAELPHDMGHQTAIVAVADVATSNWGGSGIPVALANQWRKALATERGERQELAGAMEVARAEMAALKHQFNRLQSAHNSEIAEATHRALQIEKQLKDSQARLTAADARLREASEESRIARGNHAETCDELSMERDACRRLRLQVSVTQGSIDVLTKALTAARADLAAARAQQLADALVAQTLSRQVEELGSEAAARLRDAEDAADRLARAQLERLLELRAHPFMESDTVSMSVLLRLTPTGPPTSQAAIENQLMREGKLSRKSLNEVLGGPMSPEEMQEYDRVMTPPNGAVPGSVEGSLSPAPSTPASSRRVTHGSVTTAPTTPEPHMPHRMELSPEVEWHSGLEVLERHLQLEEAGEQLLISGPGLELPHNYEYDSYVHSMRSTMTPSNGGGSNGAPALQSVRASPVPSTGGAGADHNVFSPRGSPMPSMGGSMMHGSPVPSMGGAAPAHSRAPSMGGAVPAAPVTASPRSSPLPSVGGTLSGPFTTSPHASPAPSMGGGAPAASRMSLGPRGSPVPSAGGATDVSGGGPLSARGSPATSYGSAVAPQPMTGYSNASLGMTGYSNMSLGTSAYTAAAGAPGNTALMFIGADGSRRGTTMSSVNDSAYQAAGMGSARPSVAGSAIALGRQSTMQGASMGGVSTVSAGSVDLEFAASRRATSALGSVIEAGGSVTGSSARGSVSVASAGARMTRGSSVTSGTGDAGSVMSTGVVAAAGVRATNGSVVLSEYSQLMREVAQVEGAYYDDHNASRPTRSTLGSYVGSATAGGEGEYEIDLSPTKSARGTRESYVSHQQQHQAGSGMDARGTRDSYVASQAGDGRATRDSYVSSQGSAAGGGGVEGRGTRDSYISTGAINNLSPVKEEARSRADSIGSVASAASAGSRASVLAAHADAAGSVIRRLSDARASRASAANSGSSGHSAHSHGSAGQGGEFYSPAASRKPSAASVQVRQYSESAGGAYMGPATPGHNAPPYASASALNARYSSMPGAYDSAAHAGARNMVTPGAPGRQSPLPSTLDAADFMITTRSTQMPSMVGRLQASLQGLVDVTDETEQFKMRFGTGGKQASGGGGKPASAAGSMGGFLPGHL